MAVFLFSIAFFLPLVFNIYGKQGDSVTDKANANEIRKYLLPYAENIIIETVNEIDSTNDEMKKRALQGEKEIILLVAESQTKGKGSKGRAFFSPESTGCYMSFLLRPGYSAEECTLLTTMAAAATAESIEAVSGQRAQIKWINDIYIERRKVAGILTEASISKGGRNLDYAVVGIGINIAEPQGGFPAEIKNIAAAVLSDNRGIKNHLIGEVINRFIYYYQNLIKKEYLNEYRKRLFFLGENITVVEGDKTYTAKAVDIDDMCHLIAKTEAGEIKTLFGGEISIRPEI